MPQSLRHVRAALQAAFQTLLSRPIRAYLETAEVPCDQFVQRKQAVVSRLVVVVVFSLCFSQIPVWNPRDYWFAADYDGMDGGFNEPVASVVVFSALAFLFGQFVVLGLQAVTLLRSRQTLGRADCNIGIFNILVQLLFSCLATSLAIGVGMIKPEVVVGVHPL